MKFRITKCTCEKPVGKKLELPPVTRFLRHVPSRVLPSFPSLSSSQARPGFWHTAVLLHLPDHRDTMLLDSVLDHIGNTPLVSLSAAATLRVITQQRLSERLF